MSIDTSKQLQFSSALIGDTWQDNVVIGVSSDGRITSIESATESSEVDHVYDQVAIPGMPNVHSHAFQRAFAGLSEYRTADNDSFWTWRKLMYDFLLKLTPEDMYVIARQLYLEMLLSGYTWVGEFHYVHNDCDGKPYGDIAELSSAIIRAARDTGIGLCMLPVLYQRGGFDDSKLEGGQKRFELSNEQFLAIHEELSANKDDNFSHGIALHSLRAVSVEVAQAVIAAVGTGTGPIHIHVAEQTKEIDDCQQVHGQRSVEFLLNNFDVNENWCLIHATHLDDSELAAVANSNAVVGLCPTTEANLGDGIFRGSDFLNANGRISIGSDSHCSVDFSDELRTLEYGQRLQSRQRAILGTAEKSVGRTLFEQATRNGGRAIGVKTGVIAVGYRADFMLIDQHHPAIAAASGDALLDRLIFCHTDDPIVATIVGGVEFTMDSPDIQELVWQSQQDFNELNRRLIL